MSNIVSEVAQGLGNQAILENKETIVPEQSNENSVRMQQLREQKLREQQQAALESIGKDSFNGVNVFEGGVMDMRVANVLEPVRVVEQAIQSATETAVMILRIDDVISSRAGGGGGMPDMGGMDMGGMGF